MDNLVAQILDGMKPDFPDWQPGTRPIHSKGIAAVGYFRGSEIAQRYCCATHFRTGWTPVTVRFSNGNGQLDPDYLPQVRGMAIRFHNGARLDRTNGQIEPREDHEVELADLVCMSVPMFMVNKPEDLLSFERALEPRDVDYYHWWRRLRAWLRLSPLPPQKRDGKKTPDQGVLDWAKDYPEGLGFVLANANVMQSRPPESYARTTYFAVHAFELEDDTGVKRMGRFILEPATGVRRLDGHPDDPAPDDDYLQDDLRDRLGGDTARFNLHVQLADPGDVTDDPTVLWPSNRRYVRMGTLELERIVDDQQAGCEKLGFNPGRLVKGINLSDDPTLHARIDAYNESQHRRGAEVCPFGQPG